MVSTSDFYPVLTKSTVSWEKSILWALLNDWRKTTTTKQKEIVVEDMYIFELWLRTYIYLNCAWGHIFDNSNIICWTTIQTTTATVTRTSNNIVKQINNIITATTSSSTTTAQKRHEYTWQSHITIKTVNAILSHLSSNIAINTFIRVAMTFHEIFQKIQHLSHLKEKHKLNTMLSGFLLRFGWSRRDFLKVGGQNLLSRGVQGHATQFKYMS